MKKNFLIFFKDPTPQSRKNAVSYLRERQIQILAQYSNTAFEVSASDTDRKVITNSGFFSEIYDGPINVEQVANRSKEAQEIVATWNLSHETALRMGNQKSDRGLSWGSEGHDEPRPHSELSEDFFLKSLKEKGIRQTEIPALKNISFSKSRVQTSFATIEKKLLDKFKDPTKVYHLSRLAIVHPELEETILNLPENVVDGLLKEKKSVRANLGAEFGAGAEEACWRMNGEISIGVVFVESSRADGPKFNSADRTTLRNEIQTGLNWLASQHPAGNLSWVYNYQYVSINVANGTSSSTEDYWRNPAMQAVSYNSRTYTGDWNGVANYRNDMRTANDSAHAIVIFVTPYGTDWHAYASNARLTLANRNNWGGWGINTIDAITVHEVCHLFGAADEYTGSGTPCTSCTTTHGCDSAPNGNCKACAPGGGTACIMDQNSLAICPFTKRQIGWPAATSWRRFELAGGGIAATAGSISSVSRIPTSMELWWIGANGSIEGAYWYQGNPWGRYQLAPAGSAAIGGSISAVSRIPNSMELWWIGANGSIQGAYWYAGSPWRRYELAPANSAAIGGSISAVSRIPNSMELWWIGGNGSIQAAYWYDGSPWRRYELAPANSAAPSGAISAVSRIPNSMELWWIGSNGSIQAGYWYDGSPWRRYELAPANSAATNGGISAVSRIPNSMELWWIGGNGSIQAGYWYDGSPWRRYELAPANSAATNGGINAVSRIPNSMELWWIGANGSIQDAYWYDGSPWRRFELAPLGSASINGDVNAVSRIPGSMEVWWIGANGSIQDAYWYG